MTELKLEKRNLIVQLTEEEAKQRADLAAECADVAGQAQSRAALLGEQAKAAKKEAETKSKEAGKLLAVYRAKEESQLVQCRVEHNRVTDEVHVVRLDTAANVCGNGKRRGGVPVSEFVKIALDPMHREHGRCCEGCKAMLRKMGRLVWPK